MLTMKEETKAIKRALKDAGYDCSVKKGVGSARCWIYVAIRDRPESKEENEKVADIVFKVDGRRDGKDDLSIEFSYFPYIPAGLSDLAYHGIMAGLHDDPCGGRDCDTCEIGGCDHGIESELNPELRDRMERNSNENKKEDIKGE